MTSHAPSDVPSRSHPANLSTPVAGERETNGDGRAAGAGTLAREQA